MSERYATCPHCNRGILSPVIFEGGYYTHYVCDNIECEHSQSDLKRTKESLQVRSYEL